MTGSAERSVGSVISADGIAGARSSALQVSGSAVFCKYCRLSDELLLEQEVLGSMVRFQEK